jgi:hypothetical protein
MAASPGRRIDREVAALVTPRGHPNVVHVEEVVYTPGEFRAIVSF